MPRPGRSAFPRAVVRALAGSAAAVALVSGCTSASTALTPAAPSTTATPSCPAHFFGVPGSGQGAQNPPPGGVPTSVTAADAHAYGIAVAELKNDLVGDAGGELKDTTAVSYPAIPANDYLGLTGLKADKLDASEAQGITSLQAGIATALGGGCSTRAILLAGYSQGAEVVIRAVTALSATQQRQVTVTLFGDPSFMPGVADDFPAAATASGLRDTFLGQHYSLPVGVQARTLDICAPGDPICGVDTTGSNLFAMAASIITKLTVHETAYNGGSPTYASQAATFLWTHRVNG